MADLRITGLHKHFGNVHAVRGVDLQIADGEFTVLVGPSGCGKSTLLRAIAGLEDIDAGTIAIGGNIVNEEPPHRRDIAMVFQNYALYPYMTVFENIAFGLRARGTPGAEVQTKVQQTARLLAIDHLLARHPRQLSGGQLQRVAIGRAIVRNARLYLFDEPLSNLDAQLRDEMRSEIKRLHQELGKTMIYVTHDQIEALTLADRIAIMKSGIIQQLDDPTTIYNRPRNLFVAGFIGSPSMNFLRGELVKSGDGIAFSANGVIFSLAAYDANEVLQPGRKVVLGVRPEHIKVNENVGGEEHDATVDIEEPMGADNLLWLKHAGHTMSVRVNGARRFNVGAKVKLSFDMTVASVVDAESELRL